MESRAVSAAAGRLKMRLAALLVAAGAGALVVGCSSDRVVDEREPANIGGVNYNKGTFDCKDAENGLESRFTFGGSTATFVLKGDSVALNCGPVSEFDAETQSYFRDQYKRFVDMCVGDSKKGRVVAATSNSMGAVQMTAFLVGPARKVVGNSVLNCSSAARSGGGW